MADYSIDEIAQADKDRFWSYVEKGDADQCWPYTGGRTWKGYGSFWFKGASIQAPKFALLAAGKSRPSGLFALHSCDNPPCCNPAHLDWGSQSRNMLEKFSRGRGVQNARRGEDHRCAKITAEDVREIRAAVAYRGVIDVLAAKFRLSRETIKSIRCRTTWKHID